MSKVDTIVDEQEYTFFENSKIHIKRVLVTYILEDGSTSSISKTKEIWEKADKKKLLEEMLKLASP